MKPFLYFDNWHEPQPPTRFDTALAASGLEVVRVRTNDGEFPDGAEFCGAYVSPSFDGAYDDKPWIHQEHDVLRALADAGVPMLGLCFGCQILASSLCGRDQVVIRDEREKGYGAIALTEHARRADPLTKGMPETVPVFHWHGDEVRVGHPDIVVLASSDDCPNQIWRWRHGPVWGVQPHPEFDRAQLVDWFTSNQDMFVSNGFDHEQLVSRADDHEVAGQLIGNFLAYVRDRQAANVTGE